MLLLSECEFSIQFKLKWSHVIFEGLVGLAKGQLISIANKVHAYLANKLLFQSCGPLCSTKPGRLTERLGLIVFPIMNLERFALLIWIKISVLASSRSRFISICWFITWLSLCLHYRILVEIN